MREADRRPRGDRLWRRLAAAQDEALAARPEAIAVTVRGAQAAMLQPGPAGGRRVRARRWVLAVAVAGAAAAAVAVLLPGRTLRFQMARTGEQGAPGRALVAEARSDLPLRFSDGSAVTFRAGSAGRVQRLTEQGAEVVIDRGHLDVSVVHAEGTLWRVHAGPFKVRVTGTRFTTTWNGEKLQVALYEGSVVIEGALLGAGVPLRAGQRLTIEGETVVTEPLAIEPNPGLEPGSEPVRALRSEDAPGEVEPGAAEPNPGLEPGSEPVRGVRAKNDAEWAALAARGDYPGAFRSAERLGWSALCRRADARRLLILGDVARYAGAGAQARQAFEALVSRFPRDRLAADAVFSLGRLAFEGDEPALAARWFGRYVDDWPRGPLAEQAAGRLLECAVRLDDRAAVVEAARGYLTRAPNGPRAALAREALARPAGRAP